MHFKCLKIQIAVVQCVVPIAMQADVEQQLMYAIDAIAYGISVIHALCVTSDSTQPRNTNIMMRDRHIACQIRGSHTAQVLSSRVHAMLHTAVSGGDYMLPCKQSAASDSSKAPLSMHSNTACTQAEIQHSSTPAESVLQSPSLQ
jgi:hypothetical protein